MLVLKRAWTEGSHGVHREMSWTMSCSVQWLKRVTDHVFVKRHVLCFVVDVL
ncbi:hypothetical protein F2Q69_00049845 [Brassica cretica]|uniref:Uncharacterized protein n=1 Tax=Brassica cretica TaxID=69181 RepID=A0A8S9PSP5_BRACR|nr:hypothetical protein F2Q69_00049845 [Brassica cretica]